MSPSADLKELYTQHLQQIENNLEDALERSRDAGEAYDGVYFHAGSELLYHRDDQPVYFRSDPHFARIVPHSGPEHLLRYRSGEGFELALVRPRDYWYETPRPLDHPASELMKTQVFEDEEAAIAHVAQPGRWAFVGEDEEVADELHATAEPSTLLLALDWSRGVKTGYEVHCLEEAARRAAPGHAAVCQGASAGASERELHFDFLHQTGEIEADLPYPTIIGWNEHAAVLHYQSKDRGAPGRRGNLLIDAGVAYLGYACDITRTWVGPDAPGPFRALRDGLDAQQRELVAAVAPGVSYVDLHVLAHRKVAELLHEIGVLRIAVDEAMEDGWTRPFFPHGLGHHLGLQVHDVGGHLAGPDGRVVAPPPEHPFLRTTRRLEPGHVVTIEPGIYFIEMLLEPLRSGPRSDAVDWKLVDQLARCGGIRIEDDVVVTEDGSRDLTRGHVPG